MLRHIFHYCLLIALAGLAACAGQPRTDSTTRVKTNEYSSMVASARTNPAATDFTSLRIAYTETDQYRPFVGAERALETPMFAALQAGQFDKALELAREILDNNYVSIDAHYVAWQALLETGDNDVALRHRVMLDGLLESISSSGDGMQPETAYQVISNTELHAFLGLHGFQARGQAVVHAGDKTYSRVSAVNADNQRREMYFDVTLQTDWQNARREP